MSAQRVPVSQQEAETSGCTSQTSADAWLASGGASEAVAVREAAPLGAPPRPAVVHAALAAAKATGHSACSSNTRIRRWTGELTYQ